MQFIEQENNHHPTIKFMAEISETEMAFLDTSINKLKGERFQNNSDVSGHFKPTENVALCHPTGVKKASCKKKKKNLKKKEHITRKFKYSPEKCKQSLSKEFSFNWKKKTVLTICYDTAKFPSNLFVSFAMIVNEIIHPETVGENKIDQSFLAKHWTGQ